ncbi:MAG: DNA repair protein MmcB-related protein [Alphaproteobacteria bacterium]|nr:DNA repair protein MmcB-related protein [Alphaproteobacteria bacterium]
MLSAGDLRLDMQRPCQAEQKADGIARGACRVLAALDFTTLTEMPLASGQRCDVIGLGRKGRFAIVEIKSSLANFRADQKWAGYLPYCAAFYFAVPCDFPHALIPAHVGLLVADRYGGEVLRAAPALAMTGVMRRRQLARFARVAAHRLREVTDPTLEPPQVASSARSL